MFKFVPKQEIAVNQVSIYKLKESENIRIINEF